MHICVDVIMCSIIDDEDNISIKPSATTTLLLLLIMTMWLCCSRISFLRNCKRAYG